MIRTMFATLFLLKGLGTLAAEMAFKILPSSEDWKSELPFQDTYDWQALQDTVSVIPPQFFQLNIPNHPSIKKNMDFFQTKGRGWLEECLKNSLPYKDFVFQQLEAHQVPSELFFLAAVESDFKTSAVSRSGATGLWQFMKNSIHGYGMELTDFLDERKDFWKSTIGAIRKLKDNYQHFGDWYLALAAYNAGAPRVKKAIMANNGVKNYWELVDKKLLPKETCNYIPLFLAMVKLASNKSQFGLPITWEDPYLWTRIPIDRAIDLRLLASAAGVPFEQLLAANRELKYPITPEKNSLKNELYHLKVPVSWSNQVKNALDDASLKLIRLHFYTVQKGDTLSEIAQWYGVDTTTLVQYNTDLVPDKLKPKQTIVIPAIKDVKPFQKSQLLKEKPLPSTDKHIHVVQAGDTLYSLAKKMRTTALEIAHANGISLNDYLIIGQKLVIPARPYDL